MFTKSVIINGKGTSGKDTIVNWIQSKLTNVKVYNFSSIDPVRKAAEIFDCSGKSEKDRKFMSELKKLSIWYNDHPTNYLLKKIDEKRFKNDKNLFFLHIREPKEIDKMVFALQNKKIDVFTLLVDRKINKTFNNDSDDFVGNYNYNFCIDNSNNFIYTENQIIDFLKFIGVINESEYIELSNKRSSKQHTKIWSGGCHF